MLTALSFTFYSGIYFNDFFGQSLKMHLSFSTAVVIKQHYCIVFISPPTGEVRELQHMPECQKKITLQDYHKTLIIRKCRQNIWIFDFISGENQNSKYINMTTNHSSISECRLEIKWQPSEIPHAWFPCFAVWILCIYSICWAFIQELSFSVCSGPFLHTGACSYTSVVATNHVIKESCPRLGDKSQWHVRERSRCD